ALHRARFDEGALDLVQLALAGQPLDGDDLAALGLPGEHQARAHELAVEVDAARPALALLAGVLGSGQVEVVAQRAQQALPLPHAADLPALAVDGEAQAHRCSSQAQLSVRRASTPIAWRRYAALPRTSSIGCAAPATSSPNRVVTASSSGPRPSQSRPASA